MSPTRSHHLGLLCLSAVLAACGGRGDTVPGAGGESQQPADATAAGALVVNGDFELGRLEPWSTLVHADPAALAVDLDASAARQGAAGLRLVASGTEPWGGVEQTINATEIQGRQLELSAWVRGQGMTGSPALLAVFEGGPWSQPVDLDFEGLGSDFEWRRISTRFEMPATAKALRFGILIKEGGVMSVDDVELVLLP